MDPEYEHTRVQDEGAFLYKLQRKRRLYRLVGEIYVGRRVKLAYFRQWLARIGIADSSQVLEVGSGDGIFAFFVAGQYPRAEVTGLELNQTEATVCQKVAAQEHRHNLHFEAGILGEMQWQSRFDLIYCLDVLEHITEDVAVLREMHDALKSGGHLLIHVPSRTYQRVSGEKVTVPDEEAWRINPGHVRNGYDPDEMRRKLESAGFIVVELKQTQGRPIARIRDLYQRIEHFLPFRFLLLPLIDRAIQQDMRHPPAHGNTLWALAKKN